MGNFSQAYERSMKWEGGYVDDPDDTGKETYKGVSRKYHPKWNGWEIVDEHKKQIAKNATYRTRDVKILNNALGKDRVLQAKIKEFYKKEFWDKIKGDKILDYELALQIFDFSINAGVKVATLAFQRRHWVTLTLDGILGKNTLKCMNNPHDNFEKYLFVESYKVDRIDYYRKLVNKPNTKYKKYLRGWLNRVFEL